MYQIHVNVRHRGVSLLCCTFSLKATVPDADAWVVSAMSRLGYYETDYDIERQISPEDL